MVVIAGELLLGKIFSFSYCKLDISKPINYWVLDRDDKVCARQRFIKAFFASKMRFVKKINWVYHMGPKNYKERIG